MTHRSWNTSTMWHQRAWLCLLLACLAQARIDTRKLAQLIPSQSCYYLSYSRVLNCNCNSTDTSATMDFELGYYIGQSGDDIREVMVAQCKELYVRLDLRGVDATNFALTFKYITKLVVESVEFEPLYSDRQELRLKFNSVEQLSLSNLNVQAGFIFWTRFRTLLHALTMSQTIPDIRGYSQIFPVSEGTSF